MRRFSSSFLPATLALAVAALGACASAGGGGDDDDDRPDANASGPDGNPGAIDGAPIDAPPTPIDATPIDAAPQAVTLNQSTASTIVAANSVACSETATGFTTDNSYYRVFPLSTAGVTTTFTPTRVDFGVEESSATAGSHTIQVRLHTMTGTNLTSDTQLTLVHGQNFAVPNTTATIQSVTLSANPPIAANLSLVLEIAVPDGTAAGNTFYIGSNAAGEAATGYIRSPIGCTIPQPVTLASLGFPTMHMVMSVTGTTP